MKKPNRRLAAIMFTDIVGYSAMMQKDETIAYRIRKRHKEVFSRLTNEYDGTIIQYFGDGTLSIYPSAAAAVECAVALQRELKNNPPVPIRVGIHTGDITYNEEEAYGDGVNVAARIESLCIPGGVFISEKVYDDIKNHSRLSAKPIGTFDLKNIQNDIKVYAVDNQGLTVPEYIPVAKKQGKATGKPPLKRKNKFLSGLLAFFFGLFGAHRFYLGQRKLGIVYLAITLTAMFIIPELGKFIGIMAIIGFVDAILLWSMSRINFDAKYNEELLEEQSGEKSEKIAQSTFLKNQFDSFFQKGKQFYQHYKYQEAVDSVVKAIEIKYDEPEAHFFLARCYSILENAGKALAHLDAAVAFGFKNKDLIHNHDDLAFLRIQPEYDTFVNNGYRLLEELPAMPQDNLRAQAASDPDLLEQLNQLHQLYEDGVLTKEEYLKQEAQIKSKGFG